MNLEQLRKQRGAMRRQVTLQVDALTELLKADAVDEVNVQAQHSVLQETSDKLRLLDEKILMEMTLAEGQEEFGDKEMDEEFQKTADYQKKIKVVEALVRLKSSKKDGSTDSVYSSAVTGQEGSRQYKLPKIQLKKFDGNLHEWLGWWSQFSKIHEDVKLHDVDKFMYLSQSMVPGTRAKELVDSYPMTGDNYPAVIEALRERFGQEDLLIPHYIRGLLKIVIKNATSKEKVVLSSLYDKLETDIRSLGTLKVTTQEMGRFLHPIVESCLTEDVFVAWQRSPYYGKDGSGEGDSPKSKLDYLLQFLKEEAQREMRREQAKTDFNWDSGADKKTTPKDKTKKRSLWSEETPTSAGLLGQTVAGRSQCLICDKTNHRTAKCFLLRKMTHAEKIEKLKQKRACFVCLETGHRASACKQNPKCQHCSKGHLSIICPDHSYKADEQSAHYQDMVDQTQTLNVSSSNHAMLCNRDVLLKTALVRVRSPGGDEERLVRVLFDDGSQRSYITKRISKDVKSIPVSQELGRIILMDGSATETQPTNVHEVVMEGMPPGSGKVKVTLRERPQLGGITPRVPAGPWIQKLRKRGIRVTDWDLTHVDRYQIDILIGSDYYEKFRTGKRVQVGDGLYAVETIFGWTMSGPLPEESLSAFVTQSYFASELSQLWDLEAIGIRDSADSESREERDARVKEDFQSKLTKNENGEYVVRIPFKDEVPVIPTNLGVAKKRLEAASRKVVSLGEYERYNKIFLDWEKEGFIEEVEFDDSGHFLPHRPVFKPESETTPVRPVYDASCRVGDNPSLNMLQETGPNMIELMPAILLRFRRYAVAAVADIRKAFQMLLVHPDDRKYQKFLWWKDYEKKELKVYQHRRVVFGMTSSPFALAATLDIHLDNVDEDKKEDAEKLKKSLYVDNVAASFRSEKEYFKFKQVTTKLMSEAKMELRLWESNADWCHEKKETSVLGYVWNKAEDTISCKIPKFCRSALDLEVVTSRKVLAAVHQVFDVIGFTAPNVIQPKIMLQKANMKGKNWDDTWDEEQKQEFMTWIEEAGTLCSIKIPRFAFLPYEVPEGLQLHVFVDASNAALGCAAYVRVANEEGVRVQLLMGKARVAPLEKKRSKKVTIPRLEFLACEIGTRIAKLIRGAYGWEEVPTFFWSDSSACLHWINQEKDWGVFIRGRRSSILKNSKIEEWRHVPGVMNPADLPSRGCTAAELLASQWWEGPEWLKNEDQWPASAAEVNPEEVNCELMKTAISAHVVEAETPYSHSYLINVRIAAWIRRFITNCRIKKKDRVHRKDEEMNLSFAEIRKGERDLLYGVQRRHFGDQPQVKGFQVAKFPDGLWRLKTRLIEKTDTDSFKFPIVLPRNDAVVQQLIEHIHRSSYHSGIQHVMGLLREKYWIIHARTLVKKMIHKCVTCQRYRISNMKTDPTSLPAGRVETVAAFQTTGVDLAGPLVLHGGSKAWIVLYTCAVYRGVHFDVVDSLSAHAFLLSLERFVNTVGRPSSIYSDNGTNFVATRRLLKLVDWKEILDLSAGKRISWTLNPPSAPWFGGFWERLVRSMKELLRKMMGRAQLTYDELRTCLAAAQQVINSRPLTTVTGEGGDLMPLTPAHFMRDLPVASFPEGEEIGAKFLRGSYQKIQMLKASLQARFRREYLGVLTSKNCEDGKAPPKIGSVVLVGDANKKRFEWPLGRIEELIEGRDGKLRVAKVRTNKGILTRPLQRLYLLEIPDVDMMPTEARTIVKDDQAPATDDLTEPAEEEEPNGAVTRYGRVTKAPIRYGKWRV